MSMCQLSVRLDVETAHILGMRAASEPLEILSVQAVAAIWIKTISPLKLFGKDFPIEIVLQSGVGRNRRTNRRWTSLAALRVGVGG